MVGRPDGAPVGVRGYGVKERKRRPMAPYDEQLAKMWEGRIADLMAEMTYKQQARLFRSPAYLRAARHRTPRNLYALYIEGKEISDQANHRHEQSGPSPVSGLIKKMRSLFNPTSERTQPPLFEGLITIYEVLDRIVQLPKEGIINREGRRYERADLYEIVDTIRKLLEQNKFEEAEKMSLYLTKAKELRPTVLKIIREAKS